MSDTHSINSTASPVSFDRGGKGIILLAKGGWALKIKHWEVTGVGYTPDHVLILGLNGVFTR
jgi:hypothetical protein